MKPVWLYFLDIALATIGLRLIIGWIFIYRRLLRLLLTLLGLVLLLWTIHSLDLIFSPLVILLIAIPTLLIVFFSFLPEFKKIYESASLGLPFRVDRGRTLQVIPSLTQTLLEMSQRRMGALLVFQKNDAVNELVSGGEELDAQLNKSLLLSIFNVTSPRHDGAVLLQQDRIVRMGVVLPLPSSENAKCDWGTRHLAAIGLTEKCDAEVLVVSEQRGTISHARRGLLCELPQEERQLEEHLEQVLGVPQNTPRVKQIDGISLLFWFGAFVIACAGSLSTLPQFKKILPKNQILSSREAEVQFINLPDGLFVHDLNTTKCQVWFSRSDENYLVGEPKYTVTVDLKQYGPGSISVNLMKEMLNTENKGWRLERFEPEQLVFVLAQTRQMKAPIEPTLKDLPANLRIKSMVISPTECEIRVQDPDYKKNRKLRTLPIDLAKLSKIGSYSFTTRLDVPESIQPLRGEEFAPVQVQIEVVEKSARPLSSISD